MLLNSKGVYQIGLESLLWLLDMLKFMLWFSGPDYVVCAVFLECFSDGISIQQVSYVDLCSVYLVVLWFGASNWIILFES